MSDPNRIYTDTERLHPKMRDLVSRLLEHLTWAYQSKLTHSDFKLFETVRSPARQNHLFTTGTTKARGGKSPHQFGLAVDIVAKTGGRWSWAPGEDWKFLAASANAHGLLVPIAWDRVHVEYPDWKAEKGDYDPFKEPDQQKLV